jgi:hypothetical protein
MALLATFMLVAAASGASAPEDLFDHYGVAVAPGSEKLRPCQSKLIEPEKLGALMHSCVAVSGGGTPEEQLAKEQKMQDDYGRELHRAGWRSCSGLANVLFFFNPAKSDEFIAMMALDEAWLSELDGQPHERRLILVFVTATKSDIPFKTCPPKL